MTRVRWLALILGAVGNHEMHSAAIIEGTWQEQLALAWVVAASGDVALLPTLTDLSTRADGGVKRALDMAIGALRRTARAGAS